MIQVDMHTHSKHSGRTVLPFLRRIGAMESYTEIESLYKQAKQKGMTHVTITDHDTIEGSLKLTKLFPDDTFISAEISCHFPEGGEVHLLVYDITKDEFKAIKQLSKNIYKLRDFLREENICYSVAHATRNMGATVEIETLEKLILLFDIFESLNGARSGHQNRLWSDLLRNLTEESIRTLQEKHNIEPWGDESWNKGFTAGSNDHAGLFCGQAYTSSSAENLKDFISDIQQKIASPCGLSCSPSQYATSIYVLTDKYFGRSTKGLWPSRVSKEIKKFLFKDGPLGLDIEVFSPFLGYHSLFGESRDSSTDESRTKKVSSAVAEVIDEVSLNAFKCVEEYTYNGRLLGNFKNLSSVLSVNTKTRKPLRTLLHYLVDDSSKVVHKLSQQLQFNPSKRSRKILWFSDTIKDLNGVSATLKELANHAFSRGWSMQLITSYVPGEGDMELPPNHLNLPYLENLSSTVFAPKTFCVPSVLASVDLVAAQDPDEIIISTPGPVGILGLIASVLLGVRCTGVYHTDFTSQVELVLNSKTITSTVERYITGFFKQMDRIYVPTKVYMNILEKRGLDRDKMKLFRRVLDPSFATTSRSRQLEMRKKFKIPDGIILMWAGRAGREKSMDFLFDVYDSVSAERENVNLLVVGEGAELAKLKERANGNKRIVFTGRLDRTELAHLYSLSDLFVFPSTTDTFGMVLLEAKHCGLPAVVADEGGGQELIDNGHTGFVLPARNKNIWTEEILRFIDLCRNHPVEYKLMSDAVRNSAKTEHNWDDTLSELAGIESYRSS